MILGKKTQVLDFLTWKTCTASTLPLPLRSKCVIAAVWEPRWAALPNNMQPHLHRPNSACVLGRVLDTSTPTAASTLTAMCTERASRGVTLPSPVPSSFRAHTLVGRQTLNPNPSLQQVVEKTQRNVLCGPATAPPNLAMPRALWSAGRTWVFTNFCGWGSRQRDRRFRCPVVRTCLLERPGAGLGCRHLVSP